MTGGEQAGGRDPFLKRIERSRGSSERLVFIPGFHTGDCEPEIIRSWCYTLRRACWRGSIHYLWWDSGTGSEKARVLHDAIDWIRVNARAREAGSRHLPRLLRLMPGRGRITLLAHSLGALVALRSLEAMGRRPGIADVVLVAAAVDREAPGIDWKSATSKIHGRLYNLYSTEDECLGLKYKLGQIIRLRLGAEAAGRSGISTGDGPEVEGVIDIDATDLVGKLHTGGYIRHLDRLLGDRLWRRRWRRRLAIRILAAAAAAAMAAMVLAGVTGLP